MATNKETTMRFGNAKITIQHSGGQTEYIRVLGEVSDSGELLSGPLYTEGEWDNEGAADWEYDTDAGLTFQGRAGGPYNFARYSISTDNLSRALGGR